MIYLKPNTINPVLLYVSKNSTFTNYIFKFKNISTDFVMYYVGENMSSYICTYDLFEIELDDDETLNINFIDNQPFNILSGQYEYTIIKCEDLPTDFDEAKELDIFENYISIGKMVIEDYQLNSISNIINLPEEYQ